MPSLAEKPIEEVRNYLRRFGLEELLEGMGSLSLAEKRHFFEQIDHFGIERFFLKQLEILARFEKKEMSGYRPVSALVPDEKNSEAGRMLMRKGKIATLLLAGGQGSRLQFSGPKGLLPLTGKTLFQIFFEKVAAALLLAKHSLKVAVMVSPQSHQKIAAYFKDNHLFGMSPSDLDIFPQNCVPLLNKEKKWFLEKPGMIALAPEGNGKALFDLMATGILDKWKKAGVAYIHIQPIDNPLAIPFDPELAGLQFLEGSDLCIRAVERSSEEEAIGVLAEKERKIHVVEYSEVDAREKKKREGDGLYWKYGYSGIFSMNMSFAEATFLKGPEMPWHAAKKKYSAQQIPVWKFESFLFDLFPLAKNPKILHSEREKFFCPIKTEGDISKAEEKLASIE